MQGAAGLPGLSLGLDFTLLDAAEQVMTDADVESATIELSNGDRYSAEVQKIDAPWSLVILIDASKTLTGYTARLAFQTARNGLADSIKLAPRDSNIAVLTFGSQPITVMDFTREGDKVEETIRKRIRAQSDSNSCLNEGAYEAVSKLSGAIGRRAVVILTASADSCGQRPAQDVIDLARRNHIQIYAMGLKGYSITQEELAALAGQTGGLATLKEQDDVVFACQNYMNALSGQWQARATAYPPAGEQTAQLSVTLKDKTILSSGPATFVSDRSYARPPEISIKGQVLSVTAGLQFTLSIVSPDLIGQFHINVISKKTGSPVMEQNVTKITEVNEVPADNLVAGEEYTLVVVAVDSKGQTLSQTSADFSYAPPQPELKITQIRPPTAEQPEFTLEVESHNLEGVVKYKVWLVAESSKDEPVNGTTQTVPVGDPLRIPVTQLQTGSYQVVVQALDSNNAAVAEVISDKIPYRRPGLLQTAMKWLGDRPLAIAAIALVFVMLLFAVAIVVWAILPKPSAKPKAVDIALPPKMRRAAPPNSEPRLVLPSSVRPKPARESDRPEPRRLPERAPERQQPIPRPVASPPDHQPALPKACLSSYEPADVRFAAEIVTSPCKLGRREGNDLVIKVDNRSGVSGRHATFTFADGRFYITDDNSTYGTLVNGEKIQPGTPIPLEDGTIIGLGPMVKIQFNLRNCP